VSAIAYHSDVELRRLHYFCAVADELHFGRAAQRLHVAQPAVSQQIRALEAELGAELFRRDRRRVSLTEAGRLLLEGARPLLAEAAALEERVRAIGEGRGGRLRIHTTRSAPAGVVPEALERFRETFPEVELELVTGFTGWNLAALEAARTDIAVVRPPVDAPEGWEVVPLVQEELVVALPAGHPLARRRAVRRSDLLGVEVVSWPRRNGPGLYDAIVEQVWGSTPPDAVREEPDDERIFQAVAAGAGVAVMIGPHVRHLRAPGAVTRRFAPPVPTVGLALAWVPTVAPSSARHFVDLARQLAKSPRGSCA
jgi:DNA-binding transcriptional LysR family regulator